MEIFFQDPNAIPLPPEEVRFTDLKVEPYPDGQRIRINLDVTPFQKRPYIELVLSDQSGNEVSTASIVEPMTWKLELTMHIRGVKDTAGRYTLVSRLFYPEQPDNDRRELTFEIQAPA